MRSSQVEGGGEGLYAKRDIKKGEVVSFYNGVLMFVNIISKTQYAFRFVSPQLMVGQQRIGRPLVTRYLPTLMNNGERGLTCRRI